MREENPQKTSGLPAHAGNEQEKRAPVTKLVIDRSRWYRGHRGGSALLRSGDSKMCCLGFYGRALGISSDALRGRSDPYSSIELCTSFPSWLVPHNYTGSECQLLIRANDSEDLTDSSREQTIAEVFAKHGVTVTFVDAASPVDSESPEAKKGPDHP